jgi:hypothetical protein
MPRHFACSCDPLTKADERMFINNRGVGETAECYATQTATLAKSTPQAADLRCLSGERRRMETGGGEKVRW